MLVALVQTDLGTTLLVALGYLVVNTGIGSILEPRVMGRGLGISTLAVFQTMALMIALDASPQTRPIAVLLGPDVADQPESEPE